MSCSTCAISWTRCATRAWTPAGRRHSAPRTGRPSPTAWTACCYAKSDKYWATDPTGIAWETYHTLDSIPVFGGPSGRGCCVPEPAAEKAACCTPAAGGCC